MDCTEQFALLCKVGPRFTHELLITQALKVVRLREPGEGNL
jgi:hypothetical protein